MRLFNPITLAPLNKEEFQGYSLVIPSLSVGNVGQLAIDVVLASLESRHVGSVQHPSLLPVVGSDPMLPNSDRLMTACEVFACDGPKLLVVQIRSSVSRSGKASFVDDLLGWAGNDLDLEKVVVLSSFAADERVDSQIASGQDQIRFMANAQAESIVKDKLENGLGWRELEKKRTFPSMAPGESASEGPYIPGGGLTKAIHLKSLDMKTPLVCLLTFASEGDNSGDALRMVAFLDQWLQVIPKRPDSRPALKFPISWNHMFGNPAPNRIY